MNRFKILFLVLMSSAVLNAGGIGVYVPYSLGIKADGTFEPDNGSSSDYDYDLKNKPGIGLAYATNLGKSSGFGYKLAFEITHPEEDVTGATESDKYDLINTFEFGIIKSRFVRVWAGPRINIGFENYESTTSYYEYEQSGFEIGIAPAVGINFNIGNYLALTFDVDYKFAAQIGSVTSSSGDGTYTQTVLGPTARLGVFFKFNEKFEVSSPE